ncbi:2OG-Fe(II) oxygenase [Pseudoxanthomonas sp. CF125]|uniref:2OG-Fe(II) oxygenase n=1 Tax=Pseudoxanthomonas sp. CF125 TaxID=1855303 RepID=UPI0008824DE4|nr:2OG-Fe(II) oxygenase [Pseudoxanthomonas sp. CF125]SDQ47622.1 SM-20-related protein [Pseudoxanthomonas sp. CF125]
MPSLPAAVLRDPAALAEGLDQHGACLLLGFPNASATLALRSALRLLQADGNLRAAEVGHGRSHQLRIAIRGDDTRWMDADSGAAATAYLSALRSLRVAMNRRLFLGMEEEEAQFACYPAGASYHRHSDQFQDSDTRVLSMVSYLNDDWLPEHGGALRLYLPQGTIDVLPHAGTSVAFLSGIEHEVLPATRERLSVAAWLRKRAG